MIVDTMVGSEILIVKAIVHAKQQGWITNGDVIVLMHGLQDAVSGASNVVKIIEANSAGFTSPSSAHFSGLQLPFVG